MSYIGNIPTTAAFPFDQFSGNGTTTAFTLTYAPAGPTSIIVSISGVVQNPNLYSVIGTTITFSPAPPSGTNNIAVLYLGLPVITPAGTGDFTTINDSGNLNFTGTGNRITGDFSNATAANRVLFQSSTANGFTAVSVIPNGTSTSAFLQTINNSDPTNASTMQIAASVSESQLSASRTGTGTYLPMTFYTGGSERFRYGTSGEFGVAGANYGTSGQVLTSGGSGAAPSWQTIATTPQIQTQTLSSGSGSWSKPTNGGYQWVQIEVWAGGGSGGKSGANNRAAGGGGGGAYNTITVPLSYLASSESYTVGAGGAAVSTNIAGNVGGNTSFNISNWPVKSATIDAFGGGGGGSTPAATTCGGGGGGGIMSVGANGTASGASGGEPSGGTTAGTDYRSSTYGGGTGANSTDATAGLSYYGGSGGGGGNGSSPRSSGGISRFGGGGGGGTTTNATVTQGGTSTYGGNGGAGSLTTGNGTSGSVPGGGGGATMTGTSGAGAAGQIRLTWW
jgi:hypothetical protein